MIEPPGWFPPESVSLSVSFCPLPMTTVGPGWVVSVGVTTGLGTDPRVPTNRSENPLLKGLVFFGTGEVEIDSDVSEVVEVGRVE